MKYIFNVVYRNVIIPKLLNWLHFGEYWAQIHENIPSISNRQINYFDSQVFLKELRNASFVGAAENAKKNTVT